MKFRKTLWITVAMLAAILLSSCNMGATPAPTVDPGVIETQAFSIVLTQSAAQQTQTALAIPPTPMPTSTLFPTPTFITNPIDTGITPLAPIPGFTPLASPMPTLGVASTFTTTNGCNDGYYEGETRPYDGAQMKPGEAFEKAWTIKNTGTCAWDEGYSFAVSTQWSEGIDQLGNPNTGITIRKAEDVIKPGMSQSFKLNLQAPKTAGQYKWCWKLKDDGGNFFGPLVCTTFVVAAK